MTDLFSPDGPPPRRRGRGLLVFVVATLVVAVVGVGAVIGLKRAVDARPAPQATAEDRPHIDLAGLAKAVSAKDRAAFLSYARGDAVAPMTLWYDNMQVIGYRYGGFTFENLTTRRELTNEKTLSVKVRAGTAKPGSMLLPATTPGGPERGVVTSTMYAVTIEVDPAAPNGFVFTSMKTINHAPWDFGPLVAVDAGPVRLVGEQGDEANIQAYAPAAQRAATAFAQLFKTDAPSTNLAGATLRDYLAFVGPTTQRFQEYFNDGQVIREAAGLTNHYPSLDLSSALAGTPFAAEALPASAGSTGMVTVVPYAEIAESDARNGFATTMFAHEWTHQYYAYFGQPGVGSGPPCAAEGIAEVTGLMAGEGLTDPRQLSLRLVEERVRPVIQPPVEVTDPQVMYGEQTYGWYSTCASAYLYVASLGHDPLVTARNVVEKSAYEPGGVVPASIFDCIPGVTTSAQAEEIRAGWAGWLAANS